MARRRKNINKTLPPNLYLGINGHYKYRRPDIGCWHSMGKDRDAAVSAAKQLNTLLMPGADLVKKVVNPNLVFNSFLDRFENQFMTERKLADKTIKDYKCKLVHIRKHLGDKSIDEISVIEISDFLQKFPPTNSNRYRSLLTMIFDYAVANGLCKENPAEITMTRITEKTRQRLPLEVFYEIYNHEDAEPWFKNAMDVALITLQRREDIVKMKFNDMKNDDLYVVQTKTEKHGICAYLKIKIGETLKQVINRCRDGVLTPFLIHRIPDKKHKQNYKCNSKEHYTQITPDYVTKTFSKIRDKLPRYKNISEEERATLPTFHEIRALGIKLYKDQGIDPQALAGHTTEAMTNKYDEGHGVRWTEVQAELTLQANI